MNRLAHEISPYLLQHRNNPVDWYPWGPEALERARNEDMPIFLSIGYSACHWCHVMEHESFENTEIAAELNAKFISIKVDREERPDLDQIYMQAVQALTGRGGWPMSVFLTPELKPFYGGTYWPPTAGRGMPGFDQIIAAVHDAWLTKRAEIREQSEQLTRMIQQVDAAIPSENGPRIELLTVATARLEQNFDFTNGGFGDEPKFPHPMALNLILRLWHRNARSGLADMVELNLDKMAQGGIYDHLAGGFARYSTDRRWLVPHFEKMLYDNALLAGTYLDAYQAIGHRRFADTAAETLDYWLDCMTDPEGGFHSTEDADSEGEEGKFYVWTPSEIQEVLGAERAEVFCYVYDVAAGGNWEGKSILNLPKSLEQCSRLRGWDLDPLHEELAECRRQLRKARDQRVRPGRDDKVLVSWNGLMIDSLSRAATVLDNRKYLIAAQKAATFILREMRRPDGRLLHTWRQGQARLDAYLDDYACLTNALVSLYQADFNEQWLVEATALGQTMLAHFAAPDGLGFYFTADDHEPLIARQKDLQDSSVPSGNAMAATALLRLGRLCSRSDFVNAAEGTIEMASGFMEQHPNATAQMLVATDMLLGPFRELVLVAPRDDPATAGMLRALRSAYRPNTVWAYRDPNDNLPASPVDPVFHERTSVTEPTLYVCEGAACDSPAIGWDAVGQRLSPGG